MTASSDPKKLFAGSTKLHVRDFLVRGDEGVRTEKAQNYPKEESS
jgi:hypothetical protein